jgi:CBS domain containing-hemolysin-like protein
LDPDSWLLVGQITFGIILATLTAAAETALASVNRLQLRDMAASQGRAQMAEALLGSPARLLSTLLVTKIIGSAMVIAATILLALRLGGAAWPLWATVAAIVVLLLTQALPRAWAVGRQERIVLWLAPFVRVLVICLTPITALLRRITDRTAPDSAADNIFLSEDGLRFLLSATDEEAAIEDGEKEMIASIFAFSDKLVREVLVPRIDVAAVSVDMPMMAALEIILKHGHSRIPIYKGTIDNIVGILYAKDLLRYLRDGRTDVPLERILRTAYFIPESKKVNELLQ